jgi:hypothetical protein
MKTNSNLRLLLSTLHQQFRMSYLSRPVGACGSPLQDLGSDLRGPGSRRTGPSGALANHAKPTVYMQPPL